MGCSLSIVNVQIIPLPKEAPIDLTDIPIVLKAIILNYTIDVTRTLFDIIKDAIIANDTTIKWLLYYHNTYTPKDIRVTYFNSFTDYTVPKVEAVEASSTLSVKQYKRYIEIFNIPHHMIPYSTILTTICKYDSSENFIWIQSLLMQYNSLAVIDTYQCMMIAVYYNNYNMTSYLIVTRGSSISDVDDIINTTIYNCQWPILEKILDNHIGSATLMCTALISAKFRNIFNYDGYESHFRLDAPVCWIPEIKPASISSL